MEGERSNCSGRSAVAVAGRREEKGEAEKLHMLLPPTCMDRVPQRVKPRGRGQTSTLHLDWGDLQSYMAMGTGSMRGWRIRANNLFHLTY